MGKRLIISVANLLKAGCMLSHRIEVLPADDQFPTMQLDYLEVVFPDGYKHSFDFDVDGDVPEAECDYNSYGTNMTFLRNRITNIPHMVC